MIHIYTGDGKGKTTAAVGSAIRAAGAGGRVLFFQFLKDGTSSECRILDGIENVTVLYGFDGLGKVWEFDQDKISELSLKYEAKLQKIRDISGDFDMVILDEVITAVNYGYISKKSVKEFIEAFPKDAELIMTGRGADDEIIKLCDYVSDIKKIKHPYDRGIDARKGIEF